MSWNEGGGGNGDPINVLTQNYFYCLWELSHRIFKWGVVCKAALPTNNSIFALSLASNHVQNSVFLLKSL